MKLHGPRQREGVGQGCHGHLPPYFLGCFESVKSEKYKRNLIPEIKRFFVKNIDFYMMHSFTKTLPLIETYFKVCNLLLVTDIVV